MPPVLGNRCALAVFLAPKMYRFVLVFNLSVAFACLVRCSIRITVTNSEFRCSFCTLSSFRARTTLQSCVSSFRICDTFQRVCRRSWDRDGLHPVSVPHYLYICHSVRNSAYVGICFLMSSCAEKLEEFLWRWASKSLRPSDSRTVISDVIFRNLVLLLLFWVTQRLVIGLVVTVIFHRIVGFCLCHWRLPPSCTMSVVKALCASVIIVCSSNHNSSTYFNAPSVNLAVQHRVNTLQRWCFLHFRDHYSVCSRLQSEVVRRTWILSVTFLKVNVLTNLLFPSTQRSLQPRHGPRFAVASGVHEALWTRSVVLSSSFDSFRHAFEIRPSRSYFSELDSKYFHLLLQRS